MVQGTNYVLLKRCLSCFFVNPSEVKSCLQCDFLFVCEASEEERLRRLEELDDLKKKGGNE